MKIILDTNVITEDYRLQGARILKLSDAAHKLGYQVYIPQIVIDEIFHQYKEELEEAVRKYRRGCRLVNHLRYNGVKDSLGDDFVDKECAEMQTNYYKRLKSLGIDLLPYPKTEHNVIVHKELYQKKPFFNSMKGYRDSLIWETVKAELIQVKDLLGEVQILFLSNNTNDFANAKDKTLHSDLEGELTEHGFLGNEVELVSKIDKFFSERINSEFEELDNIAKSLKNKKKYNRIDLDAELTTALYDAYVVGNYIGEAEGVLPEYCENPTINEVSLGSVDTLSVHKLTDDTVVVECEVTASADIEFYLYRGDYPFFDDDKLPTIIDWEWNEHYYLASSECAIHAIVTMRTSAGMYRVLSREVRTKKMEW